MPFWDNSVTDYHYIKTVIIVISIKHKQFSKFFSQNLTFWGNVDKRSEVVQRRLVRLYGHGHKTLRSACMYVSIVNFNVLNVLQPFIIAPLITSFLYFCKCFFSIKQSKGNVVFQLVQRFKQYEIKLWEIL